MLWKAFLFKKVYIEISNVCNLQCSFCPETGRDKKFMELDLFEKMVREAAPLTEEVCFHVFGEPLLHPQFDSCVALCNNLGVPINLTTNGILLNQRRTEVLLNPAFRQINFSLQSFEANFPGRDNSVYLQNIFDFTERALVERPDLYINYRLWNSGEPESNELLFQKIKQALRVDFKNRADVRWKKNVKLKGRVFLHFDSRFQWPHPSHPVRSLRGFCYGLSSHIGILADGTVVPCCLDKDGIINLGHCGSQNLSEIIQSPRCQSILQGFNRGILVEDLCQKCTFISRFDKKMGNNGRAHRA
ncbi:MAG: radical SAM protein [Elusimicrobia bacterium]|nr:radical SAM protein [Elusimicrobiota bacterium]